MENQCTATAKSTGERCQRPAIKGSNVCYQHGGAAEQVQKKAQERLDEMADSTTAKLQSRLDDIYPRLDEAEDSDEFVKLLREIRQLTTDILDRAPSAPDKTETQNVNADVTHDLADGWDFVDDADTDTDE